MPFKVEQAIVEDTGSCSKLAVCSGFLFFSLGRISRKKKGSRLLDKNSNRQDENLIQYCSQQFTVRSSVVGVQETEE